MGWCRQWLLVQLKRSLVCCEEKGDGNWPKVKQVCGLLTFVYLLSLKVCMSPQIWILFRISFTSSQEKGNGIKTSSTKKKKELKQNKKSSALNLGKVLFHLLPLLKLLQTQICPSFSVVSITGASPLSKVALL